MFRFINHQSLSIPIKICILKFIVQYIPTISIIESDNFGDTCNDNDYNFSLLFSSRNRLENPDSFSSRAKPVRTIENLGRNESHDASWNEFINGLSSSLSDRPLSLQPLSSPVASRKDLTARTRFRKRNFFLVPVTCPQSSQLLIS